MGEEERDDASALRMGERMKYYDEILRGVQLLASHPDTLFLGQSVRYKGHAITGTLKDVPDERKIELPVFEETQMGLSIGLALQGFIPVTIYPRMNFLLMALGQLVNHLDKIPSMSGGKWKPKVIVRTMVCSDKPLNPGKQHLGDFTGVLGEMLEWVTIECLWDVDLVYDGFKRALERDGATVLVEYGGIL